MPQPWSGGYLQNNDKDKWIRNNRVFQSMYKTAGTSRRGNCLTGLFLFFGKTGGREFPAQINHLHEQTDPSVLFQPF
jgi:hypothetical protein